MFGMLLDRILAKIRNRKECLSNYQEKIIDDLEFEQYLLNEISFLDEDFEKKLDEEIQEEKEKLAKNIIRIQQLVKENNIDKDVLKNILYSEINQLFLKNHLL